MARCFSIPPRTAWASGMGVAVGVGDGVAVGEGFGADVAVGEGVTPGGRVAVAVGVVCGAEVAVGAGLVGVAVAVAGAVGVGVAWVRVGVGVALGLQARPMTSARTIAMERRDLVTRCRWAPERMDFTSSAFQFQGRQQAVALRG